MLNTLFGWYARQNLSCKFDTIIFTESIAPNTTGYAVTITSAKEGSDKKDKLTGHNFIITDIYSVCTTGIVDAKVLPDNDASSKFYMQVYQPISRKLQIPLLLMSDIVIEFDNNESHFNNLYLSFGGFWISENRMPDFTMLAELIPKAIGNIDLQTLGILSVLEATATSQGISPPEGGWSGAAVGVPSMYKEFCKRKEVK